MTIVGWPIPIVYIGITFTDLTASRRGKRQRVSESLRCEGHQRTDRQIGWSHPPECDTAHLSVFCGQGHHPHACRKAADHARPGTEHRSTLRRPQPSSVRCPERTGPHLCERNLEGKSPGWQPQPPKPKSRRSRQRPNAAQRVSGVAADAAHQKNREPWSMNF